LNILIAFLKCCLVCVFLASCTNAPRNGIERGEDGECLVASLFSEQGLIGTVFKLKIGKRLAYITAGHVLPLTNKTSSLKVIYQCNRHRESVAVTVYEILQHEDIGRVCPC
jgi:hypothetical protein